MTNRFDTFPAVITRISASWDGPVKEAVEKHEKGTAGSTSLPVPMLFRAE